MINKFLKTTAIFALASATFFFITSTSFAQDYTITNTAIDNFNEGGASQAPAFLATLVVTLWRIFLLLGGLAVLVYLIVGGAQWLTSGGDKAKLEIARDRIINAIIGMTILFGIFAFVNFIGPILRFDLLELDLPNNLDSTRTGIGGDPDEGEGDGIDEGIGGDPDEGEGDGIDEGIGGDPDEGIGGENKLGIGGEI